MRPFVAQMGDTISLGRLAVSYRRSVAMVSAVALALLAPRVCPAQQEKDQPEAKQGAALPGPGPLPESKLLPALPTVAVRSGSDVYNWTTVDTSILPRDKEGIWVLDFAFKPVRMITLDLPGKGRRPIYYLYYKVVNHTKKPIEFVPQFTLITDTGKRYEDTVLQMAVPNIQHREDPTKPLLGAVSIQGVIPPSTKQGVDDAVYGVAIWEAIDPHADGFKIYVRGLSDGYQLVQPPEGGRPVERWKTLRIDFIRRGDARKPNEREIQLLDPPYEWIYW